MALQLPYSNEELLSMLKKTERVSNQNLLDNWYFTDPINQRGQEEYTGTKYTIDRWKCSGTKPDVLLNNGIVVKSTDGSANVYLIQVLEKSIPEGTYTFSAIVLECSGSGYLQAGYDDGSLSPYKLINGIGITSLTITAGKRISRVILQTNKGGEIKFAAAKLELGPVQTLASQDASGNWVLDDPPPNKALELLKCQRFFQRYRTQSLRPAYADDCRPVMRAEPATGTITVDSVTYYTLNADL